MPRIHELRAKLEQNPVEAIEIFDEIVHELSDNENYDSIKECCVLIANYMRNASIYKRKIMLDRLIRQSFLCRMYLSFEFRSINDTAFPRRHVFLGNPLSIECQWEVPDGKDILVGYGANKNFNLGVVSDGSAVEEPKLVNIPPVRRIKMSDSHTLFLTYDDRVYGCGKASNLLVDDSKSQERSGYIVEPTIVQIPGESDKILDIAAQEDFSVLLTKKFVYFIGNCDYAKRDERKVEISKNCIRIPHTFEDGVDITVSSFHNMTVVLEDLLSTVHFNYWHTGQLPADWNLLMEQKWAKNSYRSRDYYFEESSVTMLEFDNENIEVRFRKERGFLRWRISEKVEGDEKVYIMINGILCNECINGLLVFPKGRVILHLERGFVAKGRFEFVERDDDGFVFSSRSNIENRLGRYHLVAVVDEIPGSHGTQMIAASPDGSNIIMQLGKLGLTRSQFLCFSTEDWEEEQFSNGFCLNEIREMFENTEEILRVKTWRQVCTSVRELIDFFELYLLRLIGAVVRERDMRSVARYAEFVEHILTPEIENGEPRIMSRQHDDFDSSESAEDVILNRVISLMALWTEDCTYLNEDEICVDCKSTRIKAMPVIDSVRNSQFAIDFDSVSNLQLLIVRFIRQKLHKIEKIVESLAEKWAEFEYNDVWNDFGILMKVAGIRMIASFVIILKQKLEQIIDKDNITKTTSLSRRLTFCWCKEPSEARTDFATSDISSIKRKRCRDGDLFDEDVPLDLEIIYCYVECELPVSTNRAIFEICYPFARSHTSESTSTGCSRYAVNQWWFAEVKDGSSVFESIRNGVRYMNSTRNPITDFVVEGTANADIWNLKTTDGKIVPCHKNILLLHSRHIGAMQRFQKACGSSSYNYGNCNQTQETETPMELNVEGNETVVRNALAALLSMQLLYDKKMTEIIDVLYFFDYYLMNEAVSDTLNVIFYIVNDFTIHHVYELAERFEDELVKRFVRKPHFLFMSNSSAIPPHSLMKKFCNAMRKQYYKPIAQRWLDFTNNPEKEYLQQINGCLDLECPKVFKIDKLVDVMINLDLDHEPVLWDLFQEEYLSNNSVISKYREDAERRHLRNQFEGLMLEEKTEIKKQSPSPASL